MQLPSFAGFDLSGKRAFVTGATSGIGLGAATALAKAGAHVVCAARRAGPLGELHAAMKAVGRWTSWSIPPAWPATGLRSTPRPRISTPS